MPPISRREFGGSALALGAQAGRARGASSLDQVLRAGASRHRIPAGVAAIATSSNATYIGVFGQGAVPDSIFRIASMTKAITTTAALQLVEQGKVQLDEPVSPHLSEFQAPQLLEGFAPGTGKPILRPARKAVTLRHLLTHTSGLGYDTWDADLLRYAPFADSMVPVLVTEPGTRWEYSTALDWTGRLVERVSGLTLEEYFQRHILRPLGMTDTSFILPPEKFPRLVDSGQKEKGGALHMLPRKQPEPPKAYSGGGGLYSTAADYVRFMQMILRHGAGVNGARILSESTVQQMTANQVGALSAGKMKTARPERSSDVDFHPGFTDGFTFGFLINSTAYAGGRSAGSLAWAGLLNTFYWIDPHRDLCAVILMQFLPFCDSQAMAMLRDFEHAVYA